MMRLVMMSYRSAVSAHSYLLGFQAHPETQSGQDGQQFIQSELALARQHPVQVLAVEPGAFGQLPHATLRLGHVFQDEQQG